MTTIQLTQNVHEGKWGFYPCSRETCLKLKEAHLLLLKVFRSIKAYDRWHNKQEPKGDPPAEPPAFLVRCGYYLKSPGGALRYGRIIGPSDHFWSMSLNNPQEHYYGQVLRTYQQARRPVTNANEVEPITIPLDLWENIEKLKEFNKNK